ncbi:MAG: hypothetical protein VX028_00995 [Nanoarchaeota archaeon]|nr:hypothetical protein [Nanoarchaeota archaeon]MEC8339472.1 hypothetical protein [Nanoarchaeota archaeon]
MTLEKEIELSRKYYDQEKEIYDTFYRYNGVLNQVFPNIFAVASIPSSFTGNVPESLTLLSIYGLSALSNLKDSKSKYGDTPNPITQYFLSKKLDKLNEEYNIEDI